MTNTEDNLRKDIGKVMDKITEDITSGNALILNERQDESYNHLIELERLTAKAETLKEVLNIWDKEIGSDEHYLSCNMLGNINNTKHETKICLYCQHLESFRQKLKDLETKE